MWGELVDVGKSVIVREFQGAKHGRLERKRNGIAETVE
jgi:hypothetical protein